MTTCIFSSTNGYTALHAWASSYVQNIYVKYLEVQQLLYNKKGGALTGGLYKATDPDAVLKLARELLCLWGSFKSSDEYMYKFIFDGVKPEHVKKANLLPQFFKHQELVGPYAKDLNEVFVKNSGYSAMNKAIKSFMSKTGSGVSSIDNVTTWIELMTVSGLLHGTTLSMSRLILSQPVLKHNSPDSATYTTTDAGLVKTVAGTIVGTVEEFRCFSNNLPSNVPYDIACVLDEYDAKSTAIQRQYFIDIKKDEESFRDFGWILTDYAPALIDGKQLTLSTYI